MPEVNPTYRDAVKIETLPSYGKVRWTPASYPLPDSYSLPEPTRDDPPLRLRQAPNSDQWMSPDELARVTFKDLLDIGDRVVVSDRFMAGLRASGVGGWFTYPVQLEAHSPPRPIEGYQGLHITETVMTADLFRFGFGIFVSPAVYLAILDAGAERFEAAIDRFPPEVAAARGLDDSHRYDRLAALPRYARAHLRQNLHIGDPRFPSEAGMPDAARRQDIVHIRAWARKGVWMVSDDHTIDPVCGGPPIAFTQDNRSQVFGDILWTTGEKILVSDRFAAALETAAVPGWFTYPVTLRARNPMRTVVGYQGLHITETDPTADLFGAGWDIYATPRIYLALLDAGVEEYAATIDDLPDWIAAARGVGDHNRHDRLAALPRHARDHLRSQRQWLFVRPYPPESIEEKPPTQQ